MTVARALLMALLLAGPGSQARASGPDPRPANDPAAPHQRAAGQDEAAPILTLSMSRAPLPGNQLIATVSLSAEGSRVASLAFSLDFDPSRLRLDDRDADGDGIPDAVAFLQPDGRFVSARLDLDDEDGELDLLLAGNSPGAPALSDGALLRIAFERLSGADGSPVPLRYSGAPPPSFGDPEGRSLRGRTQIEVAPTPSEIGGAARRAAPPNAPASPLPGAPDRLGAPTADRDGSNGPAPSVASGPAAAAAPGGPGTRPASAGGGSEAPNRASDAVPAGSPPGSAPARPDGPDPAADAAAADIRADSPAPGSESSRSATAGLRSPNDTASPRERAMLGLLLGLLVILALALLRWRQGARDAA